MLRITTAGDVDDGKSTLIGRLLYECHAIYDDHLQKIEAKATTTGIPDLSLVADGLKSEREQGITIDVAYKYFATEKRYFILADAPGHLQYTRNMITAASTAQAAMILVDATHGIVEQTRRHAYLLSLLQVPHIILVINKIDLVNYNDEIVTEIAREFQALPWYQEQDWKGKSALTSTDIKVVPISALWGDNVVTKSAKTPWYLGQSLLEVLQEIPARPKAQGLAHVNVQLILRAPDGERLAAGTLQGGPLSSQDRLTVFPSGSSYGIKSLYVAGVRCDQALPGEPVALSFSEPCDLERGQILAHGEREVAEVWSFNCDLIWFDDIAAEGHKKYILRSGTQSLKAHIHSVHYGVDLASLTKVPRHTLGGNDIAYVKMELSNALFLPLSLGTTDHHFILVDGDTGRTVGAGMVREILSSSESQEISFNKAVGEPPCNTQDRIINLPRSLFDQNDKESADLLIQDLRALGWKINTNSF